MGCGALFVLLLLITCFPTFTCRLAIRALDRLYPLFRFCLPFYIILILTPGRQVTKGPGPEWDIGEILQALDSLVSVWQGT